MRRTLTLSLVAAAGILATLATGAQAAPPCFQQARAFGDAVTAMGNLAGTIENPSSQVRQATAMRNQGMEACLAGRVREGRASIEQAIAMLKG
jgi:phospholipase/lecithinase/hemolysin